MFNSFSPNMLKTYKTCPRKFYYQYIESVRVPMSSRPFEKGKKIHALANYFLQGVNIARIETALTQDERAVWKLLLENEFFQKDYVNSEFQLSCKVGKYWIGGRLDAVVRAGDDYFILDYKTGSTPKNPEFDYQTMVYLLCLDKFLKDYNSLSFVYINLKDKQNYVIKFNDLARLKYEQLILERCEGIVKDTIYNSNPSSCKYCEFAKICTGRE